MRMFKPLQEQAKFQLHQSLPKLTQNESCLFFQILHFMKKTWKISVCSRVRKRFLRHNTISPYHHLISNTFKNHKFDISRQTRS